MPSTYNQPRLGGKTHMVTHPSADRFPAASGILTWLVGGLTAATILTCIGMDICRRYVVTVPDRTLVSYADWDGNLTKAAGTDGLFLRFVDFQGLGWGYTTNVYFRGVYVLYPQTVLVADPQLVVNDAIDIERVNMDHDDTWMRQHGIASVLTIAQDNGLCVVQSLRHIRPTPPPSTISP